MEKEFIDIINNNRAIIFKVCHLYCRNREKQRDLFQEVVLQLWKAFPAFKNQCAYSTWVYRVSLNTAISNLRQASRKPEPASLSFSEFEIPDSIGSADEENRSLLHVAIDKLSEIEKAIIMLYLDEKTYEEISEIIGISNSNVGVRLNRIKQKLSNLIKQA